MVKLPYLLIFFPSTSVSLKFSTNSKVSLSVQNIGNLPNWWPCWNISPNMPKILGCECGHLIGRHSSRCWSNTWRAWLSIIFDPWCTPASFTDDVSFQGASWSKGAWACTTGENRPSAWYGSWGGGVSTRRSNQVPKVLGRQRLPRPPMRWPHSQLRERHRENHQCSSSVKDYPGWLLWRKVWLYPRVEFSGLGFRKMLCC